MRITEMGVLTFVHIVGNKYEFHVNSVSKVTLKHN